MSLTNPVRIDVSEDSGSTGRGSLPAAADPASLPGRPPAPARGEPFALPEGLQHHFVVVPSKLRLTTLSAFILWKCKVSGRGGDGVAPGGGPSPPPATPCISRGGRPALARGTEARRKVRSEHRPTTGTGAPKFHSCKMSPSTPLTLCGYK